MADEVEVPKLAAAFPHQPPESEPPATDPIARAAWLRRERVAIVASSLEKMAEAVKEGAKLNVTQAIVMAMASQFIDDYQSRLLDEDPFVALMKTLGTKVPPP